MKHIILIVLISIAAATPAAVQEPITGTAYVKDGDTFTLRTEAGKRVEIRPASIDAPELGQVCERDGGPWFAGWDAGHWLARHLHGKTVTCHPIGEKSYGRVVARCTVDGQPLEETIVRAGWAFDYPKYSKGRYAAAEAEASAAGRGVHAGKCAKPWDWRREYFR